MRAIQSATSVAAELLRMEDDIGSVKPGLQADLVAVRGNPLDDVKLLQDVRFVMKAGKVVKEPEDRVSAARTTLTGTRSLRGAGRSRSAACQGPPLRNR